jgi:hypothetical protein
MAPILNPEMILQRWRGLRPMNTRAVVSPQRQSPTFEERALSVSKTLPVNHSEKQLIEETELVCSQVIRALTESEVLTHVIDVVPGHVPHGEFGLPPACEAADLVPQFDCGEIHQL